MPLLIAFSFTIIISKTSLPVLVFLLGTLAPLAAPLLTSLENCLISFSASDSVKLLLGSAALFCIAWVNNAIASAFVSATSYVWSTPASFKDLLVLISLSRFFSNVSICQIFSALLFISGCVTSVLPSLSNCNLALFTYSFLSACGNKSMFILKLCLYASLALWSLSNSFLNDSKSPFLSSCEIDGSSSIALAFSLNSCCAFVVAAKYWNPSLVKLESTFCSTWFIILKLSFSNWTICDFIALAALDLPSKFCKEVFNFCIWLRFFR